MTSYQLPINNCQLEFGNRKLEISHRGLTLIELLLVIAIVAILGAASAPGLSYFLAGGQFTTASDKVARTLRKAQSYSFNGKLNSVWGVHYEPHSLVLFKGETYLGRDPSFDERFSLSRTVAISGWSDLYFYKLRGGPSQTLSITLSVLDKQRTITVNAEGMVDVQ